MLETVFCSMETH